MFFFFNDTATTEIYTLSLHDALPISTCLSVAYHLLLPAGRRGLDGGSVPLDDLLAGVEVAHRAIHHSGCEPGRSEEHTSELQSRQYLVCRLLLEKKTYATSHIQDKNE